ncbi:Phosphate ABC transporter, periplasmic phosphate-binding protein PstS [Lachnospiraceae bacterium TWA4]|nr:Phosphate ABC transporter, periplasmic phosphate-binding protein PstS [Lachnospiraceae bacterium TWA4]
MKKLFSMLLICIMTLSLLAGCANTSNKETTAPKESATQAAQTEAAKPEVSNQILFNGSSTLAPVITKIATDFFDTYGKWNKVDAKLPESDIAIYVSAGGSGQGTKAVIDNTAQFGMVARKVKDEEKTAIKDEKEYQVGIDALTIAVNPENPVTKIINDLSTEQIVALFSGEYATWKDLDSSLPAEEVVVITRDINGGAHEVFQKNIMGDKEVKSSAIQASSMGELVQDIIDNKFAIGYASFGVANQNEGKVVPMKVNGVEPTAENIVNGSYIIQRPLLLVHSGEPTEVEQAFLDVVLGEEGQKIVESMGFIPVK